jgi:hypothetical protein
MSRPASLTAARLERLPSSLPIEGGVSVELIDGVPVLRASAAVQARVEALLDRTREGLITDAEREELDGYEALDDHLGLVNRLARDHRAG